MRRSNPWASSAAGSKKGPPSACATQVRQARFQASKNNHARRPIPPDTRSASPTMPAKRTKSAALAQGRPRSGAHALCSYTLRFRLDLPAG